MKTVKKFFKRILAFVLAVVIMTGSIIPAHADMMVSEFSKEFFVDVVSEYSGEFPGMFRYKNGQLYVDVQTLVAMAEFVSYEKLDGGGIRMARGGFAPEVMFWPHEVIESVEFIWYVPFEKAMNELAITCQYYEEQKKLAVYPLRDNVCLLPETLEFVSTYNAYQMYEWRVADFYGLDQSVTAAKLVDYTRNWGKIPSAIAGTDDYERLDNAVKNILIPNASNYYISEDIVKTINDFANIEGKIVGDIVETAYGAKGVYELFVYEDGIVKPVKILDMWGDSAKVVFGSIANAGKITQAEDLANLLNFANSATQVNTSTVNGFKLIQPYAESEHVYLSSAIIENLEICKGDGTAMRTAIVRQIADGLLQMSMDIATEKMMGLWVDCAKWITEETLGTQTQVDGVLNAWANLTVQDACKRPIKTQKRRYEKASSYVEKAEAIQAWRDVTLVHLYAAQNAFEGFGDEMDNSDMIWEIKGHIYDLLEYDEMEFNIARQVDKARSTIRQEAWNSIVPVEIYWDSESADLDFDVRADLPYGSVVLDERTGSFNKTNGFSVVVTEFMQSGYRFMGVAESEWPVEILISVSDEMAGTARLYDFDISLTVNYEEIDNPMKYIEYASEGDYLKLVFKDGVFQK